MSLLAPIYPRVQTVCEEIIGSFDAKRFSLRLYSKTNDALVLFAALGAHLEALQQKEEVHSCSRRWLPTAFTIPTSIDDF